MRSNLTMRNQTLSLRACTDWPRMVLPSRPPGHLQIAVYVHVHSLACTRSCLQCPVQTISFLAGKRRVEETCVYTPNSLHGDMFVCVCLSVCCCFVQIEQIDIVVLLVWGLPLAPRKHLRFGMENTFEIARQAEIAHPMTVLWKISLLLLLHEFNFKYRALFFTWFYFINLLIRQI